MTSQLQPRIVGSNEGAWLWWLGGPIRFVGLGADTGDTYALSVGVSPSGGGPPPHRHSFEEGFYVLGGELAFTAGNQEVRLGPGSFINIGSLTAHGFRSTGKEDAVLLAVAAPAGFDRFQLEAGHRLGGPDERLGPPSTADLERIRAAAPRYGIDLDPPAEAFRQEPRITVRQPGQGSAVWVVGDRYTFLAEGEDTSGTYALWEAVVPSGGGPPPHVHSREHEGFYVLEGELTFHAHGRQVKAGPGTFLNLPPGVPHSFKNESPSVARILILVAPAGLEKMFYRTGQPVTDRSAAPPPVGREEIERLLAIAPEYGIEILLPSQGGPT